MPELPEVEFCRACLSRWTRGRRVVDVAVLDARSVSAGGGSSGEDRPIGGARRGRGPADATVAARAAIAAVVLAAPPEPPLRHGKRLLWPFGGGALLLHLGMTGKWTRTAGRYDKARLDLDDGSALYFHDPRLLGLVAPMTRAAGEVALHAGLGPDALDAPLPALTGRRPVKVALLDQTLVAGIGNVQAMEALWRAGIHPATPCDALTSEEQGALASAVRETLLHTLASQGDGDTITYVEESLASNPFAIYRREGTPCPRCKTSLERLVQAGRSTYWCPRCQPARPR